MTERKEATRMRGPVRLAIISTPRTGNNWLQHLLSRVYCLPRLSPTNLPNLVWGTLPAECVVILHWRRTPELLRLLDEHGFQVISMARHPLDVLVSILQYTLRERTDGWLQGEGGNERTILGRTPCSPEFLEYATGPRAAALLAVTCAWWHQPGTHRLRYEDLVRDPHGQMQRLIDRLGAPVRHDLGEAIAGSDLTSLRQQFPERAHHFWQGRPGLWRRLLPVPLPRQIAYAQRECFTQLGYAFVADPCLSMAQAEANWCELIGVPADADPTLAALQNALFDVRGELEQTRARLASVGHVGPWTLSLAQGVQRWSQRFPRMTRMVKRWMRRQR